MDIIGTLMDEGTRDWIPGASIEILDVNGRKTGAGFTSNTYGSFATTVPLGSKLLISHVNYYPITVKADYFENGEVLEMSRKIAGLPEVTVTAKKKNSNWLLWVLGGAVATKLLKLW